MTESRKITKVPSFFKVLIKDDFSVQLQIPKAFVTKFGELLSKNILLQTASDNFWKVGVENNANEGVYFRKGWEEFAKYNLLEHGDFVVFEYVGNSTFKVKMYGSHCCEKKVQMVRDENPTATAGEDDSKKQVTERVHNQEKRKGVVADLEDAIQMMKQKHHKSRSLTDQTPWDGFKVSPVNEVKTESNENINYIDLDPPTTDNEIDIGIDQDFADEGKLGSVKKERSNEGVKEGINTASDIALEEAKRFKSDYPYFHVVLHHSYVNSSALYLPTWFYRKHMKDKQKEVKLEVSGRLWTVELTNINGHGNSNYAKLSEGWRVFSMDNKLKVGDVSVFEMRESTNFLFKVHIFRC